MNAIQYKIILPDNYDMSLIRQRVKENGHKTDNFQGLLFKAYLISEKVQGQFLIPMLLYMYGKMLKE